MKRQIVNIINFIRGCEPREGRHIDLLRPVTEQIALMDRYGLEGTFLIQYDALTDPAFTNILKTLPSERFEIGLWFEIVQQQAEAAGLEWKGRYSWDHRSNFAMPVGYTPEIREKIVDLTFDKFYEIFGFYPKSVGGWVLDSHTLKYISEKYGADAFCNCKDQYGTDGYTLWGGYYGQGYYPSENNAFCPAQTEKCQIDVPVFRMLGSDPIYQYDLGVDMGGGPKRIQDVLTLEPISEGGSDPKWIDWYFENNFSGRCLSFGYAQAGQENSFGWERMEKGLEYQFRRLDELQKEGKVTVEKLCDTGKWYKDTYESTPASSIAAYDGSRGADCASVWYCCKNYRINIYKDGDEFRIRDMYLFNENYPERYKDEVCDNEHSVYDNLPVTDGNALSGNGILGGIYFKSAADSKPLSCCGLQYEEPDGQSLKITALSTECGDIEMVLTPSGFSVSADKDFIMENRINRYSAFCPELKEISEKKVVLNYRNFEYELGFSDGEVQKDGSILSCCGKVKIDL